jgi:hypothetical protein
MATPSAASTLWGAPAPSVSPNARSAAVTAPLRDGLARGQPVERGRIEAQRLLEGGGRLRVAAQRAEGDGVGDVGGGHLGREPRRFGERAQRLLGLTKREQQRRAEPELSVRALGLRLHLLAEVLRQLLPALEVDEAAAEQVTHGGAAARRQAECERGTAAVDGFRGRQHLAEPRVIARLGRLGRRRRRREQQGDQRGAHASAGGGAAGFRRRRAADALR